MGTFEVLPHTADVGFRARGRSLPDLFETAARAMFSIEYDLTTVEAEAEEAIQAEADDLDGLMEAWLSELLWLHDALGFVPATLAVEDVTADGPPFRVAGRAGGCPLGEWFEQTGPQIKAVTMHGLEVRSVGDEWEATVYLDV
jgi:SHS2 domain-containing protein